MINFVVYALILATLQFFEFLGIFNIKICKLQNHIEFYFAWF